ncbi:MAG: hypothetical protein JNL41_18595 [Phenylobacterium sp.]|uniref:oxidoreductase-like domain-containing protein n=1 Tax=Phenylobacterium sp. TaxID=1871053 RepID=UPI001A58CBE4|nr:oxidoreductase-like domain-containing protein [Phenylobacterium sp.]MBL8556290.1 hypothetical protein [Phenylobacterium sp.]
MEPPIPRPPTPPDPQECCQRGCDPCILDYYDRALERWETRIRAMGLDPDEVRASLP